MLNPVPWDQSPPSNKELIHPMCSPTAQWKHSLDEASNKVFWGNYPLILFPWEKGWWDNIFSPSRWVQELHVIVPNHGSSSWGSSLRLAGLLNSLRHFEIVITTILIKLMTFDMKICWEIWIWSFTFPTRVMLRNQSLIGYYYSCFTCPSWANSKLDKEGWWNPSRLLWVMCFT